MILWISGNTGSGKTTLSDMLEGPMTIQLDGDGMRETINKDLDLSEAGRRENNLRIARLADHLHDQGFDIIVSVIAPYRDLRKEIKAICPEVKFIYLLQRGTSPSPKTPYEIPTELSSTFNIAFETE